MKHLKKKFLTVKINPVIKLLIFSDVLILGAAGMLAPLFALFVEDFIVDSSPLVISVSMGIYLVARSLLQIPTAVFVDKIRGEKDDFLITLIFSIAGSLSFLLYLFINHAYQLYLVQLLMGAFNAITYPGYMAIFTRHIDKRKEGTEWGVYFTVTDLAGAFLAVIGGVIASSYGYESLIIVVSSLSLFGSLFLYPIKKYIYK